MADEPEFNILLDRYLGTKRLCDQWSPLPDSETYLLALKDYVAAREALNEYMLFMRRLVHSHPVDINAETDI